MILVLKSWFHVEDAIYHTENWKVYVAKQKNIGVSDMFTVKTHLLVWGIPTELKEHLYKFQVKHRVLQKQFLHNELFLFFMIDNHFIMFILREVFPEKN
jgi:hypothetical protein